MGSRIIPHLAQIMQVLYNRLKECGALPFFGACHGQPRRRHRRGTDRLDPGAWHYETEYRHTDPLQHGNRLLRFSGGWNALTPMRSMGLSSSTRSSPTLNFAAPTRADLPRWLPSALASMWWPPSFTLGDMPGSPGISPGWRSCSCKNAVVCLRWVLSRMRRPDQRAGGPPAGGLSVPGAKPCQSSPADVSPLSKVEIDVLIIDQIGKNISGAAMTPM